MIKSLNELAEEIPGWQIEGEKWRESQTGREKESSFDWRLPLFNCMPEGRAEVSSGSSRLDLWRHLSETQTSAGLTASDKWDPVKAKQLTLSTPHPKWKNPNTHKHAHGQAEDLSSTQEDRMASGNNLTHSVVEVAGGLHPNAASIRMTDQRRRDGRERNSVLRTDFYTFLLVAKVWEKLS